MGNTKTFEIVLASAATVFLPGQCIEGHVLVELSESMKMKGLFIMCNSKSEVIFKYGKTTQRGVEDYLNLVLTVYGNPSRDGDDVTLSAGKHAFPFRFVLPANLPGSYEGEPVSYVRHWLKAVMDRPWKFNKEFKMVFTVASILDLNTIHNAASPLQATASETSCCFGCCHGGTITATFRLAKSGYVPGEAFGICGEVNDGANAGINGTVVKFVRRAVCIAAKGAQIEKTVLIKTLRHGEVAPGGTDVWDDEKLPIPAIAPSYLAGCNIIDIQYYLKSPLQATASETSCCFGCCHGGTITATFRLAKSGYVPGEAFGICGEVNDGANAGINGTVVKFVRRAVCIAAKGAQIEKTVLIKTLRHGEVAPGGTDVWDDEKLPIPAIAPSYLAGCNIIDIQYYLKVKVIVGNCCSPNIKLEIPVIIGTVPLYSTVQHHRERRQRYQQNAANETQPAITDQPQSHISPSAREIGASGANAYVDLPPPSYQECTFGKVNTKDEGENYTAGNLNFAPSYTYYEDMV